MPIGDLSTGLDAAKQQRRAAFIAFATNGALVGSLLPRYPEIADALDLTTKRLGFAVVAFAVGAAAAWRLPERPLRRYGAATVTTVGTWAIAAAFIAAANVVYFGPSMVWLFVLCLGFAGFADAIVDVAQNAEGLRVQRALGRPVLTTMHAGWSAGAATSGLIGTAVAGLDVPLPLHLGVSGTVCGLLVTAASRRFLPHHRPDTSVPETVETLPPAATPLGQRVILASVLIALAGLSVEAIGNDWSAWFVREIHDVETDRAGFAVATVLGAQFVGRSIGDRAIDLLGESVAVRSSLTFVFAGILIASWSPAASLTLVGFAAAGFGSAVTVPVAFAQADRLPGLPPGRGIAAVAFAMRAATLIITPAIGIIGDQAGLRVAMSLVAALALVALLTNRNA